MGLRWRPLPVPGRRVCKPQPGSGTPGDRAGLPPGISGSGEDLRPWHWTRGKARRASRFELVADLGRVVLNVGGLAETPVGNRVQPRDFSNSPGFAVRPPEKVTDHLLDEPGTAALVACCPVNGGEQLRRQRDRCLDCHTATRPLTIPLQPVGSGTGPQPFAHHLADHD